MGQRPDQHSNDVLVQQVCWNVAYHRPTEEIQEVMSHVRLAFEGFARTVIPYLPVPSREASLCATHIEEACMYAMAALARAGGPG